MAEYSDFPMEGRSNEQLLSAAHGGSPEAFEVFCERCFPQVSRFLSWYCDRRGLPSDIYMDFAQDVVLKALAVVSAAIEKDDRLPKISVEWLIEIGRNLVNDHCRRESKRVTVYRERAEKVRAETPSQDEVEEREEVIKFFEWLHGDERDMIEFVWLEGMSIAEAGRRMGLSKWRASKVHKRAFERLGDLIRQHGRIARES